MFSAVGVDSIGSPCLGRWVGEAGLVDLGPDGSLTIEGRGSRRGLGDVNEHWALVTARDGVLAGALVVLVPVNKVSVRNGREQKALTTQRRSQLQRER